MVAGPFEQRNPYKGSPPRPWLRLRINTLNGTTEELELLADTGNPCAIICGQDIMTRLKRRAAPDVSSNFGLLEGGWIQLSMPELGLDQEVVGYASDTVMNAA